MGLMTAALLLGAGSAAYGAVNAAKERKSAEADMERNKTMARENAKLKQTQEQTGANIVLGDAATADTTKSKRRATPKRPAAPPTVGTTIGNSLAPGIGLSVGLG